MPLIPELLRSGQYRGICREMRDTGSCTNNLCKLLHSPIVKSEIECFVCTELLTMEQVAMLDKCRHVVCVTCFCTMLKMDQSPNPYIPMSEKEKLRVVCPFCKADNYSYLTLKD